EPVKPLVSAPVVLDLQNVHSAAVAHKRRAVLSSWWRPAAWKEALAGPGWLPGLERRWRQWEAAAVARCARVAVCSDADRVRIGGANVVTIPNCYPRPAVAAGRRHADAGLRVGFVGFFD